MLPCKCAQNVSKTPKKKANVHKKRPRCEIVCFFDKRDNPVVCVA